MPVETAGDLPAINTQVPTFTLTKTDLSGCSLADFGKDYGALITSGPLAGFLLRAIIILDGEGKVVYGDRFLKLPNKLAMRRR